MYIHSEILVSGNWKYILYENLQIICMVEKIRFKWCKILPLQLEQYSGGQGGEMVGRHSG